MIKIEHLSYVYNQGMPGESHALYDINLEIQDGTLNAIIGHTGSGKSTLIQHFNALVMPTGGKITVDGIDVTAKDADLKTVRRKVGLVFQYPEHQLFEETVYKDISFGPKNMGLDEDETDRRVKSAMELMGLDLDLCDRSPFELSGGQMRRVAIAGVLAMEPKVLILDEPTAGLDPKGRDTILGIIKNLHRAHSDMIIIFVSHSMEDVAKTAEHVIVMNEGKMVMEGSVLEVYSRGRELIEMGLNVPQITELTEKLRDMGYDFPEEIYTVKYAAEKLVDMIMKERLN